MGRTEPHQSRHREDVSMDRLDARVVAHEVLNRNSVPHHLRCGVPTVRGGARVPG